MDASGVNQELIFIAALKGVFMRDECHVPGV
jgi:hypothetical protein